MREKIIVSACLLGLNCKYNGGNNEKEKVLKYLEDKEIIPVCPEIFGGLSTPREPSEIKNNKVVNILGEEVTENFHRGAEETLKLAKKFGIKKALLKAKSPSCGKGKIYDGTFTSTLVEGNGITTELLIENNIEIISDNDL